MIAGLIFMFTAASYTEATVMYPEAGGSSSFARHAFNELARFFAAWAQMLNYVITVAISAFFVPHYLSVFWAPLGHGPGDVIGGVVLVALLAALNIKGTQESSRLNLVLAIGDLCTQIVLVGIGIVLVLSPDILVNNVHLGTAPDLGQLRARDRGRDDRLHRDRDDLEHGRGGAGRTADDSTRASGSTVLAVLGLYVLIPIVALSAMPVTQDAAGHYTTASGRQFAGDPVLGIVENLGLGDGLTDALRDLRRRPGGGDPADRHQRGADRRLAPHLLDGPAPPAAGGPAAGASALPHPVRRDPRLLRDRRADDAPGQDRLPGDDVLVRRDALVHDRARRR